MRFQRPILGLVGGVALSLIGGCSSGHSYHRDRDVIVEPAGYRYGPGYYGGPSYYDRDHYYTDGRRRDEEWRLSREREGVRREIREDHKDDHADHRDHADHEEHRDHEVHAEHADHRDHDDHDKH